jgi:hypothetical protein
MKSINILRCLCRINCCVLPLSKALFTIIKVGKRSVLKYVLGMLAYAIHVTPFIPVLLVKIVTFFNVPALESRDSSVGIATRLRAGRSGFWGSSSSGGWENSSSLPCPCTFNIQRH